MTTTIHFNTRRKYTNFGQRITATLHDNGIVTFMDHDRKIDGAFILGSVIFNQAEVMRRYDANEAPSTFQSWKDGMLRGGVNTTVEHGPQILTDILNGKL